MKVTIEEAAGRWCPLVRVDGANRSNDMPVGGSADSGKLYHCLAEACMAWRVFHYEIERPQAETILPHRGYCGLAGKP